MYYFQTFHERLANVNIDVARKFGKISSAPQDADTFFGEALDKWTELNCTRHFVEFRKEVSWEVTTFVQLVHSQNLVTEALQKHMKVPGSLAIQPLLDLVVQLARDLQGDFYPHFEQFFNILVRLLNTRHHEVETLEQTFTCLAYLFKFLWRLMLKDMQAVYRLFSPLLGDQYKDYINTFASESFSFLMRKVKNQGEWMEFMFTNLRESPDQAHGVGRLLFEMVKGVQKQFHSCTEQALPVVLSKLEDDNLPQTEVFEALKQMFTSIVLHTNAEHSGVVWKCIVDSITSVCESEVNSYTLKSLLSLLELLVSHKGGSVVGKGQLLVQCLCSLLKDKILPEDCAYKLLDVTALLLTGPKCWLSADHRPRIINLVYGSKYSRKLLFYFTRKVFDLPLFEKDLLPTLLSYCHTILTECKGLQTDESLSRDVLDVLVKLCLHKAPPWMGVMDPEHLKLYMLDFTAAGNKSSSKDSTSRSKKADKSFCSWVLQNLTAVVNGGSDSVGSEEELEMLWSLLYILPRIRPLDKKKASALTQEVIIILQKIVLEDDHSPLVECTHTVLCEAVVSLFHLVNIKEFTQFIRSQLLVAALLRKHPGSIPILRLSDLCYTTVINEDRFDNMVSEESFEEIFPEIQNNLSSPYHQVRLQTLHICCHFDLPLPAVPDDRDIDQPGVFAICLCAEQVEVNVNTYRDLLMYLTRLDYDLVQLQLPRGNYQQVPLRYLLGMLFIKFTLVWESITDLIKSHATGLKMDTFWDVYKVQLEQAALQSEKELHRTKHQPRRKGLANIPMTKDIDHTDMEVDIIEDNIFSSYCNDTAGLKDNVPWSTYRELLWRAMVKFPGACQPRSRILSPLLFRFIENEYNPEDQTAAKCQDIRKLKSENSILEISQSDDTMVEDEEQEQDDEETRTEKPSDKRHRRSSNKIYVLHLTLFSHFNDPKSLYLEPKLRELYFNLLQHKDIRVQKLAFDCIMTYKHKYLIPYKENFERLLDDKSFKREIVLFSIDQESTTIQPEHRPQLMPVLMRILYGKMQTKTGKGTSGKNQTQVRKNIVLRFLAGSTHQELQVFLDLLFQPFQQFCQGNVDEDAQKCMSHVDLSQVIPLRKQQGMLDTLEIIMKKLGNLLESYLPKIYHILVCLCGQYVYMLEQREVLAPTIVNFLKNLRQIVHSRICQFFTSFEHYSFSRDEIDATFSVAVWPQLEKLSFEGTYSTTGLLTLLFTWSENSRYFPLLAKVHPEKPEVSALQFVFQLLHAKNVSKKVVSMVMDITEHLLTIEDFEQTEHVTAVTVDCQVKIPTEKGVSFGTSLTLPHVTLILDHLKTVVIEMNAQRGRRRVIPERELNILSRLTEYVTDEDQSCTIVSLLLPFLGKQMNRTQDTEVAILTAVRHLIAKVQQPQMFLGDIAHLFSNLALRQSRTVLCEVLASVSTKLPDLKDIAKLITKLNAWDPKRVEEPDYMIRLEGFQECQQLLSEMLSSDSDNMTVIFCQLLVHNCSFVLANTDDMSLRDNAAFSLQELVNKLAVAGHDNNLFREIIEKNVLPAIRDNLKLKNEAARHEFLNLFAMLVNKFPSCPLFQDLVSLIDEDVEADFYSNMVHIQLHRRARALKKLGKHLTTKKIKVYNLVSYILPCVTCFIRDEQYAKSSNVLDGAVEALGAICRVLPWPRYLLLLKYYLERLPKAAENQKLIVRVVVTILDNFHFDLRNSHGVSGKANLGALNEMPSVTKTEDEKIQVEDTEMTVESQQEGENPETVEDDEEAKSDEDINEHGDATVETVTTPITEESIVQNQVCGTGLATRIHKYIVKIIVVKLYQALTHKTSSDDQHKKAQAGKYAEDEEVLRVPISLAMVKLLQALPGQSLQHNLPNVLLKVCNFLRSRAKDIRESARDTLIKIVQTLGPKYFSYILKELRASLKRGYQLHVLCFTVWALLKNLNETKMIQTGDLDTCVESLVEVFNEELFGQVAEEKEVEGIKGKIHEARSSKSFESYALVALYISKSSLPKIIVPMKKVLESTKKHDNAKKACEVLKKISHGLVDNKGLELEMLMTFIYGLTTETLPFLKEKSSKENPEIKAATDHRLQPTDTHIIAKEPKRGGKKPKSHSKTNLYIIVEFGFQVLNMLLKRSHLNGTNQSHLEMLDPFIIPVCESLASKYIKVTTTALRCLLWIIKFPLPALKQNITSVTNNIFVLLNTYAATGAARGENFELVVMCFKAVTVLVRDVQYHSVSTEQLKVLLSYAEQDMHDYTRQATAFTLLKAILSRKLVSPEMNDVMSKVQQLSITSEQPNVRLQCRQVASQFLMDYPLGKRLRHHLEFYVTQLEYEYESGRESALEMLATVFSSFPQNILVEYAAFFFVPLVSRLVNDESPRCRKLASLAIKALLVKLDGNQRDILFNMCVKWLQESKIVMRKLAAITCGLFVEVETSGFERHLKNLLPIIEHQIKPDKYQQDVSESQERDLDHLLFNLITVLIKICRECGLVVKSKWAAVMMEIWESIEHHLLYPHTWVRLASCQMFGILFASWSPDDLVQAAMKRSVHAQEESTPQKKKRKKHKKSKEVEDIGADGEGESVMCQDYLSSDLDSRLHSLCGVFCKQLAAPELSVDLAEQIIKNLIFICKVLKLKSDDVCFRDGSDLNKSGTNDLENDDLSHKSASIRWLLKRLCKEAKTEAAANPTENLKRSSVFKWIAAVALDLGKGKLPPYLPQMLQPLVKEYTNNSPHANEEFKTLVQEVIDMLKSVVGLEIFSLQFAAVQKTVTEKREGRKQKIALEAVSNPEIAAMKKMKKNIAKRDAKKRKIEDKRPALKIKKKKQSV